MVNVSPGQDISEEERKLPSVVSVGLANLELTSENYQKMTQTPDEIQYLTRVADLVHECADKSQQPLKNEAYQPSLSI